MANLVLATFPSIAYKNLMTFRVYVINFKLEIWIKGKGKCMAEVINFDRFNRGVYFLKFCLRKSKIKSSSTLTTIGGRSSVLTTTIL